MYTFTVNTFCKICRTNTVVRTKSILFSLTLTLCVLQGSSQEPDPNSLSLDTNYRKNALNFNLTMIATNEYNIGLEHYFSRFTSVEINGGPVRANDAIASFSQSWTNSLYFYEHGYTGRVAMKFYKKPSALSKWQDYISPVIFYKYLSFEPRFFKDKFENSDEFQGMFIKRKRSKFGFEFIWGKVYPLSKTFSIELYYGVGLRAATVERTDFWRIDTMPSATTNGTDTTFLNYTDHNFYIRPSIHGGLKFRINY